MSEWLILAPFIVLPALVAGYFVAGRRRSSGRKPDPDAAILQALRDSGADLAHPVELAFFLYFSTLERANEAVQRFLAPQWRTEVTQPAHGALWRCTAITRAVPTLSAIKELAAQCESVAATVEGQYDGWQASMNR